MVRSLRNTVKIYIEGGGEQEHLKRECRKAFSSFFDKIGFRGRIPRIVACGSRNEAFRDYCISLKTSQSTGELAFLLVDSEGPVGAAFCNRPGQYLTTHESWNMPRNAQDEQIHLMIQCMESWFLADIDTLREFFGNGFREGSLPRGSNIEGISKADILDGLKNASRSSYKGKYGKAAHSFKILENIDAQKVKSAFPSVNRLYEELDKVL